METSPSPGSFAVARGTKIAPIYVDAADFPGVIRAAADLKADLEKVSGGPGRIIDSETALRGEAIIVGTIGRSPVVDRLVREGKIDVSRVAGQWETFLTQVVAAPLPGVPSALVVAGSDKRGTIYGIYELSEKAGVSPWHWWCDSPVARKAGLYFRSAAAVQGPPSVKYRGIFLNDEAPDLTNWIYAKFGKVKPSADPPIPGDIANYGQGFYTKLFELILRLKGNYLWPAMWNNAFNEDDPDNPRLADEYGIVMGNSHQEPMLRAQKEWDRRYLDSLGAWNYAKNPEVLEKFWSEGIRRNKDYESIVTMGLRGANDTEMAPGGPKANMALLEKIIDVQRGIIEKETGKKAARVPQLWCLYKEVLDFYKAGMRVPDDVTLLWAEDNWGNLRRLPTPAERERSGGAGIYYHFDYHGGPRSYQWLNTSPLPKIWDQMSLAKQYGADEVWIVNVGHFKGYEFPLEYFLALGWDAKRWTADNTEEFSRLWAKREFGAERADEIASIMAAYGKYNARRKPELLAPDTYSAVDYREAERVAADYSALATRAEKIYAALPAAYRDAYYQLVLFPVKACAGVNEMYAAAGKNALYAKQGRASANDMAQKVRALFKADCDLMDFYNKKFAGGKWDHFMDQTHIGYVAWNDPPEDSLQAIPLVELKPPKESALGLAVEGSDLAWPGPAAVASLPRFDSLSRRTHFVEVFNKGKTPFKMTASADAAWISLDKLKATVDQDLRIEVSIDWDKAPAGTALGAITISGAKAQATVRVEAFNPAAPTRETLSGFAESQGCVAIEAEHFDAKTDFGQRAWVRIDDYGRTLSAMRATAPADSPPAVPGKDAPRLDYRMYLFSSGQAEIMMTLSPTLNFIDGRPLRYALAFDGEAPVTVTAVPGDFDAKNGNRDWERTVRDSARFVRAPLKVKAAGYHTLSVWMIDPGLVIERVLVDFGGAKPSYLGPPESFRGSAKKP